MKVQKVLTSNADILIRGKNAINTVLYQLVGVIVVMTMQIGSTIYKGEIPIFKVLETYAVLLGLYIVLVIVRFFIWGVNNNKNSLGNMTREDLIKLIEEKRGV